MELKSFVAGLFAAFGIVNLMALANIKPYLPVNVEVAGVNISLLVVGIVLLAIAFQLGKKK